MADLDISRKGGKRKTQTPRMDFTPMVDLGFILITFFIYTTTMAQPNAMELNMPSKEPTDVPTVFVAESTITLIPVKEHNVVYYSGALTDKDQLKIVTVDKIRDVLLNKKRDVSMLPAKFSADAHKLHVLIKPNDDCKYDDVVQLLDNMNIVDIPYYALVDITLEEREWAEAVVQNPGRK